MDRKDATPPPHQPARPRRAEWRTPVFEEIGVSAEVTAYAATWTFDLD